MRKPINFNWTFKSEFKKEYINRNFILKENEVINKC